jgi:hypothetical protein
MFLIAYRALQLMNVYLLEYLHVTISWLCDIDDDVTKVKLTKVHHALHTYMIQGFVSDGLYLMTENPVFL